ncbi:MAG: hydrogenase subunit MbhD domain-containing protein [Gemmatimonadota bacterium]
MTQLVWALDASVAVLLVTLVARAMLTRDLFEASVLFIAFGLTLSLAWVRLGAPDVALAEAALGAGVTGALFLNAFQRLARTQRHGVDEGPGSRPGPLRLLSIGATAVLASALIAIFVGVPVREAILAEAVNENLGRTGVSNPVTGVLLGFRAYDTLFEVCALVVAMVAVWSLDRGSRTFARDPEELREDPVLEALTRLVVPVAGVTAVYLVWSGSHAAGGAFQGAALLAGVGVLLTASGLIRPITSGAPAVRVLGVMGLALFVVVGVAVMPWTGAFLAYPEGQGYPIMILVEGVLTLSIAVILLELFIDVPAAPEADPRLAGVDPTGDPLGRTLTLAGDLIRQTEEDE